MKCVQTGEKPGRYEQMKEEEKKGKREDRTK